MQPTMWPLAAVLFAVCSIGPAAASSGFADIFSAAPAPASIAPEEVVPAVPDPSDMADQGDSMISDQIEIDTPCSCDCCQVQTLLPRDFMRQVNGEMVTSVCAKPNADPVEGIAQSDGLCPSTCQMSADATILEAARGPVDYNRFCNYNCHPVKNGAIAGMACIQFSGKVYKEAKNEKYGGNGKGFPARVSTTEPPSGGGGLVGRASVEEKEPAAKKEEEADEEAPASAAAAPPKIPVANKVTLAKSKPADKVKIIYDMRKLMAERLRSEAGAHVAAGAAAEESVLINKWSAKKDADLLKKLRIKYSAMGGKLEEGVSGIESDKNIADEGERKTKANLATARQFASVIAKETRDLADAAIKKAVTPCAEEAAKDRAQAKGLDKPEDWVKVVAARAANPYQKAVTDAVLRSSEYKNYADGLMNQAFGAQKQANSLIPHVNMLEAQGDVIGATIEKKQVTNLLKQAKGLQAQARGYWNTAQSTRETIPKWQMAASQAAAYAAWEYSNNALAFR